MTAANLRSVIGALALRTAAASVSDAESAWVLWEQTRIWDQPPTIDAWDIIGTFETKGECESALHATPPTPSSGDAVRAFTATQLLCLPDAIDPRGQKGVGR